MEHIESQDRFGIRRIQISLDRQTDKIFIAVSKSYYRGPKRAEIKFQLAIYVLWDSVHIKQDAEGIQNMSGVSSIGLSFIKCKQL